MSVDPNEEFNKTRRDGFRTVANIIAGADAPEWLAEHWEHWAPSIQIDQWIEARQPTKKVMSENMSGAGHHAARLTSSPF